MGFIDKLKKVASGAGGWLVDEAAKTARDTFGFAEGLTLGAANVGKAVFDASYAGGGMDAAGNDLKKATGHLFGPKQGFGSLIDRIPAGVAGSGIRETTSAALTQLDHFNKGGDLGVSEYRKGNTSPFLIPGSLAGYVAGGFAKWGEAGRLTDVQSAVQAIHPQLASATPEEIDQALREHPSWSTQASIFHAAAAIVFDPTLALGKATSATRTIRVLEKEGEVARKIPSRHDMYRANLLTESSRDGYLASSRSHDVANYIADVTRKNPDQAESILTRGIFKDHPEPAVLASLVVHPDPQVVWHAVAASIGHAPSAEVLQELHPAIFDQAKNLLLQADDIKAEQQLIQLHMDHAVASHSQPEVMAFLQDLQGQEVSLRTSGESLMARRNAIRDFVGVDATAPINAPSLAWKIPTARQVRSFENSTYQPHALATPVNMRGLTSRLPDSAVNPHQPDAYLHVQRWLRAIGTDQKTTDTLVSKFIRADGPGPKNDSWLEIQDAGIAGLLQARGIASTPAEILNYLEQTKTSSRVVRNLQEDKLPPVYGPTASRDAAPIQYTTKTNGVSHVVPFETQTQSTFHLPDPLKIRRAARMIESNFLTQGALFAGVKLDQFNTIWRLPVLLRVNYAIRNPLEAGVASMGLIQSSNVNAAQIGSALAESMLKIPTRVGASKDASSVASRMGGVGVGRTELRVGNSTVLFPKVAGSGDLDPSFKTWTAVGNTDPYIQAALHGKDDAVIADDMVTIFRSDPKFFDAYQRSIQRHYTQSKLGNRIINGWSQKELSYWLQHDREGIAVTDRIGLVPEDIPGYVTTQMHAVRTAIPKELIDFAGGRDKLRDITTKQLKEFEARFPDKVPAGIHGLTEQQTIGNANFYKPVKDAGDKLFNFAGHVEDHMVRIPVMQAVHKATGQRILDEMSAIKDGGTASLMDHKIRAFNTLKGIPFRADSSRPGIAYTMGVQDTKAGLQHVLVSKDKVDEFVAANPRMGKILKKQIADGEATTVGIAEQKVPYRILDSRTEVDAHLGTQADLFLSKRGIDLSATDNVQTIEDLDRLIADSTLVHTVGEDNVLRTVIDEQARADWRAIFDNYLRNSGVAALRESDGSIAVIEPDAFATTKIPEHFLADHPSHVVMTHTGQLTNAEIKIAADLSRAVAGNFAKRAFYDASSVSVTSAILRHIIPFAGATEDAGRRYWNIMRTNPFYIARIINIYNTPERLGLVTDDKGNPLAPGSSVPDTKRHVAMPEALAAPYRALGKILGLPDYQPDLAISKNTANFIFPFDIGISPLAMVPLSLFARENPLLAEKFGSLVYPYGVPNDLISSIVPSNLMDLFKSRFASDHDAKIVGLAAQYLRDESTKFQLGLRPTEVTAEESISAARKQLMVQTIARLTAPTIGSPQLRTPFQPYVDAYQRASEAARNGTLLGPDGKPIDADTWWQQHYLSEFNAFTVSMTKVNTGVPSSILGFKAAEKYKGLIKDHGDIAALITGPESQAAPFNRNVYNYQVATGQREKLSAQDYLDAVHADDGWNTYMKFVTKRDTILRQRGIPSLQSRSATDLRDLTNQFTTALKAENPAWANDFGERDDNKWNRMLGGFNAVVNDPRLADRPDIVALRDYLTQRQKLLETLKARGPGYSTLTNQSNTDLQDVWESIKNRLSDAYPEFDSLYERWLRKDPLKVG